MVPLQKVLRRFQAVAELNKTHSEVLLFGSTMIYLSIYYCRILSNIVDTSMKVMYTYLLNYLCYMCIKI